jgi:5-methylcytosine-specific restriction endonuclease McrA
MKSRVKRRQSPSAARYGVWDAWDGRCYWCRKPVMFQDCEIDHVIPLAALSSVGAEELRRRYGLPSDFDFDDFPNWVPTHPGCNGRKGQLLLDASPALLLHLAAVRSKAPTARAISEKIESDKRKASLLVRLATSIEAGTISKEEVEDFISDLPRIIRKAADLPEEHLFIAPNWEIIRSGDGRSVQVNSTPQAGTAINSTSWRNS